MISVHNGLMKLFGRIYEHIVIHMFSRKEKRCCKN